MTDHEPTTQPEDAPGVDEETAAPAEAIPAEAEAAPVAEGPEPTSEPDADASEPAAEPTAEASQPSDEPTDEPSEPTAEPTAEASDPAAEPTAEASDPAAEPTAEASEPAAESSEPSDEPAADTTEPVPAEAAPATPAPRPAGGPRPRPVPRPVPRPTATPVGGGGKPASPASPVPPDLTPAEAIEAAHWGRVDEDGTVYVREASGERAVGQYPGAHAADAVAFYVRRFADLRAKVVLAEARVGSDVPVKEIESALDSLTAELVEPAAVGDLDGLRHRVEALRSATSERRAAADAERAAAKKVALDARTALVEEAEAIAATDPEKVQWRPAGERLRVLLEQWKDAQRHGPRVDRGAEDALWKRFSHARSSFDRERRRFFSELEKTNADAKGVKQALVAEAEKLSTSTDWAETSTAYRDLMTRWKAAGRASRKDDDALWARFRAAQDAFFANREAVNKQTDAEFAANLQVKERLLERAERLVPVRDLAAARAALRDIQEQWEQAGKVPRADVQRVEGRLRAVETAVREAEQSQWQRSNPETRARAEGAAAQLLAAIAGLEADLAKAVAAGNARKVAEAQAALDARRSWLEQVQRAAAESR